MYVKGPHPLYISYVSPEQTKQDRHQKTLEVVGDKGQSIKKSYAQDSDILEISILWDGILTMIVHGRVWILTKMFFVCQNSLSQPRRGPRDSHRLV